MTGAVFSEPEPLVQNKRVEHMYFYKKLHVF